MHWRCRRRRVRACKAAAGPLAAAVGETAREQVQPRSGEERSRRGVLTTWLEPLEAGFQLLDFPDAGVKNLLIQVGFCVFAMTNKQSE